MSDQDEIFLSSWKTDEGNINAQLIFHDEIAELTITSGDLTESISGLALAENGKLTIFDNMEKIQFDYSLTGNTLTLEYCGSEIVFYRAENN